MRIEYLTLLFTILLQLKKHVNLLSFQKEKTIIDTGRKTGASCGNLQIVYAHNT